MQEIKPELKHKNTTRI